ncbi:uncharacterized protein At4g26485 [Ricinus communis]|uniref:uncharacterized protein At4g26485 n=1 Tax=Ricinus communis TaxID=3988 RepID=UPI00201ABBCF|nr:uncharacterized protein At4g26485 [Ricinus communis]
MAMVGSNSSSSSSCLGAKAEEKWIKHYSSSHKILLVGEGDFSFAACLAKAFGSASNMVATSLDSKGELIIKYSRAEMHLKELQDLGCRIIHKVDASTMSQYSLLAHTTFDRIVFNFPHASLKWREHDKKQIELHKRVVKGFLISASKMLTENGEVHVTHKTAHPFCNWEIEKLAEEVGLYNFGCAIFCEWDYPGYVNKRGHGIGRCDETFPVGECRTFKFIGSPLHLFLGAIHLN